MVQWLRFWASNAEGVGLIPGQGTKFSHAAQGAAKKYKSPRGLSACDDFAYSPAKEQKQAAGLRFRNNPTPSSQEEGQQKHCLLFILHLVDHRPRVAVQGHRLPAQRLLGVVQVNLQVSRSRQLGQGVLKGTENKRRREMRERQGGSRGEKSITKICNSCGWGFDITHSPCTSSMPLAFD